MAEITTERGESLLAIEATEDNQLISIDSLFYIYLDSKVMFTDFAALTAGLKAEWETTLSMYL